MKQPTVFFDLEAGGLHPNHPDIQIAAIAVLEWNELAVMERKIIFDEAAVEKEVMAINSYDREVWAREALPEEQVVRDISDFLRAHASIQLTSHRGKPYTIAQVAGHNIAAFDSPRLKRMFDRHDAFLPAAIYEPLDTIHLARWYFSKRGFRPTSFRLNDLCRHFGVPNGDAHDAVSDVRMSIGLARALMES